MGFSQSEKHAWFNLAVLVTAVVAAGVGWMAAGATAASAAVGVLGLWALGPIFFRIERSEEPPGDELERLIQQRALMAGLASGWFGAVGAAVAVWLARGMAGSVTVHVLPALVAASLVLFVVGQSIATLVQYSAVYRYGEH